MGLALLGRGSITRSRASESKSGFQLIQEGNLVLSLMVMDMMMLLLLEMVMALRWSVHGLGCEVSFRDSVLLMHLRGSVMLHGDSVLRGWRWRRHIWRRWWIMGNRSGRNSIDWSRQVQGKTRRSISVSRGFTALCLGLVGNHGRSLADD